MLFVVAFIFFPSAQLVRLLKMARFCIHVITDPSRRRSFRSVHHDGMAQLFLLSRGNGKTSTTTHLLSLDGGISFFLLPAALSKKEIQTSSTTSLSHYFVPVVLTGNDGPSSSYLSSSLPPTGRPTPSHDIDIVIVISRIERGISFFGTTRATMPLIAQGLCAAVRVAPIQATKKTGA